MRKLMVGLVLVAALLSGSPGEVSARQYQACYKSPLCNGLLGFFQFEEGSDSKRVSELGEYALEKDGVNVPNAAGKFGNAAPVHDHQLGRLPVFTWGQPPTVPTSFRSAASP